MVWSHPMQRKRLTKGPLERKLGDLRELKVTLCGKSVEMGHIGRWWETVLRESSDEGVKDESGEISRGQFMGRL